tara:strand:- start:253 stop:768 length:516 start_codon:yes stop_codon:yes gene_type:complete
MINSETNFSVKEINVKLGEISKDGTIIGNYILEIKSFDFETLYQTNFETIGSSIIEGNLGDGYFESEIIYYNITEISLLIPYYENAKEIIIYNENLIEIAREDIGMYSKQYEKENVVNESIKKEIDKKEQIEEERIYDKKNLPEKLAEYWWILLIILIVLLIVFFYSLKKR